MDLHHLADLTDKITTHQTAADEAYDAYLTALAARNETIRQARAQGMPVQAIAEHVGVTRQVIHGVLRREGVVRSEHAPH